MKVLYLIDTLEVGGAESSLLEILKHAKQTEAVVCSIYAGDTLKSKFENAGIHVVTLDIKGKHHYWAAIRKVLAVIRQEKPELVHTTLSRAHLIGRTAAKLAGTPVVSVFTSEPFTLHRYLRVSWMLRLKVKVFEFLERITIPWTSHFVANSESLKASACRKLGISSDKISVIYRGRDPSAFQNGDTAYRLNHRLAFGLPADIPVILNVGRLVPEKAQKDLILAMQYVQKEFPARLLIAGEGKCRAELADLIRKMNLGESVTLLGHRNDGSNLMSLADVFAFPSISEGHPGVLIEAMFSSCPIVASDIPVHIEMIQDRKTGVLKPAGNPRAFADGIVWMLRHPLEARQMASAAREKAIHDFHIDRVAGQQEQLYDKVLERWHSLTSYRQG